MKFLLTAFSLFLSISAFGNSFDGFIGEYKVSGTPSIKAEKTKFCNRFDFKSIKGFEVKSDSTGYKQSHVLYFMNRNGWSGHPVMDYVDTAGSYAKTTGSSDWASNEWGSGTPENEKLTVTLSKKEATYLLTMSEELVSKGTVIAACYYQVSLLQK